MSNEDILVLRTLINQVNANVQAGNVESKLREEDIQEKVNNIQNLMADGTSLTEDGVVKTGYIEFFEPYVQYDEERFPGAADVDNPLEPIYYRNEFGAEDAVSDLPQDVMITIPLPSMPKYVNVGPGRDQYDGNTGDWGDVLDLAEAIIVTCDMQSDSRGRIMCPSYLCGAEVYPNGTTDGDYGKITCPVPIPGWTPPTDDTNKASMKWGTLPITEIRWTPNESGSGGKFSFKVPAVLSTSYSYRAVL